MGITKAVDDTNMEARKDAAGFTTTVKDMLNGVTRPYDEGGTQEVGDPYGLDPMGEKKINHEK